MPPFDLSTIDWRSLIRVDPIEVKSWFQEIEFRQSDENTGIRFYRIKSNSDGRPDYNGLITYFLSQITNYVLDSKDIRDLVEDGLDPKEKALSYFGDVDPRTDGKYGELILYLLVEGILEVPLVVHKIGQIYNPNDQVKGSDGLFVGNLGEDIGLLVGESKMKNKWSSCLQESIESIERFINNDGSLSDELFVAKKHISRDLLNLGVDALDALYNSFRVNQEEHEQLNIHYPILLIYRDNALNSLLSGDEDEIEAKIIETINSSMNRKENSIQHRLRENENDTFDFFLLPTSDVTEFRELCYKLFNGGREYSGPR